MFASIPTACLIILNFDIVIQPIKMNYYFITGTSSGIGRALAEKLLESEDNYVHGIARRNTISHPRYQHTKTDLSNIREVLSFEFPMPRNPGKMVLINNAGQIGEIKPIGKSDNIAIVDMFNVNLLSPSILMNKFIEYYSSTNTEKVILNVSSGAGKKAIEGWAPYCASKAGIDLLSQTVYEEQKSEEFPVKIFSVAPGVVDTEMQATIRESNEQDFSRHAHFVGLKERNELSTPEEVADKYLRIIEHSTDFKDCVFSLRDL